MQRIYLASAVIFFSLLASSIAVGLAACDAGEVTPSSASDGGVSGCTPLDGGPLPATAPNGYYVNGNTVCTLDGKPHLLHGVDRPSLEFSVDGQNLSAADFQAMGGWHANVVRVALSQDYWLSSPSNPNYSKGYAPLVDQVVQWAHAAGMDVILDLHWSDTGDFTVKAAQQLMADMHSVQFWSEVAARYKGDGRVFFELYNEPHGISQTVWLSGGMSGSPGFEVAGMQQLYDTVRSAGANNLVLIGGLDFAYDLSFVQNTPVLGYNIAYTTHPYDNAAEREPENWDYYWGDLTETNPVVVTEFGDVNAGCTGAWDQGLITYADAHNASWTAWGWYPGGCSFPSLISTWSHTTTVQGAVVRTALLGYDDPAVYPPIDAGSDIADAATDGPDEAGDAGADGPDDTGDGGAADAGADAGGG
jgi:endoglucanase